MRFHSFNKYLKRKNTLILRLISACKLQCNILFIPVTDSIASDFIGPI
jgi:hypothetical protein